MLLLRGTTNVGIVMVHDITGLDETNRSFAKKLHAEGWWVAAVDLFGGKIATNVQEGMTLRGQLKTEHLDAALAEGLATLRREMGPGAIVGSLGFCMGGGAALQGACTSPFAFCVDWYGSIADADQVRGLQGPLLLILASEDDRINAWTFSTLLPKLDEHRKRVTVQLYPAVVHPFHRPDWIRSPFNESVKSYDARAADDAWKHIFAFIRASTS